MNAYKAANIRMATAWDWNYPRYIKRCKGDGAKLRRLARHRLKHELRREDAREIFKNSVEENIRVMPTERADELLREYIEEDY